MLNTGDTVDDFELPDETGTPRTLSGLLESGPVVLFFYPAAMTSGCTAEACHFRDVAKDFAEVGGHPVGISADKVDKQKQFADKHGFGYPLLADVDKKVATMFGVSRGLGPIKLRFDKRVTFVIDTDRTILAVIKSETSMEKHADEALAALKARAS
ncbi:MAG TPA: peroxiredoxin [Acidimicrobiales bacterium]|nr:peroxiredoxin [Acidimicrobiales bacterium]